MNITADLVIASQHLTCLYWRLTRLKGPLCTQSNELEVMLKTSPKGLKLFTLKNLPQMSDFIQHSWNQSTNFLQREITLSITVLLRHHRDWDLDFRRKWLSWFNPFLYFTNSFLNCYFKNLWFLPKAHYTSSPKFCWIMLNILLLEKLGLYTNKATPSFSWFGCDCLMPCVISAFPLLLPYHEQNYNEQSAEFIVHSVWLTVATGD